MADFPVSNILDIVRTGSNLKSEGPAAVQVVCPEHGCPGGLEVERVSGAVRAWTCPPKDRPTLGSEKCEILKQYFCTSCSYSQEFEK